jgi:hypothetical protein
MNFLSHFYFTQNKNDPYFSLGSVLPDLLRNYDDSWRIKPEKEIERFNKNSESASLLKGWELHLQVDKSFHSSEFFLQETSTLRKKLALIFRRLPIRPFFLAHVGYELTLDRLLIHNELIKTDHFYQELALCNPYFIQDFLTTAGIKESSGFLNFLNSFIESKYLESYRESKSIVHALDRIGRRVWTVKFNEEEVRESILIFEKLKDDLNPTFIKIFEEIEDSLIT